MRKKFILPAFLILSISSATLANDASTHRITITSPQDYVGTRWEGMRIPTGTMLVTEEAESGKTLQSLEFKGGVTISETEDGGTIGMDGSGHGAVGCAWLIYASLKPILDKCYPQEVELKELFERNLEKIKLYIVANSLTEVSIAELNNVLHKKHLEFDGQCNSSEMKWVDKALSKRDKFLAEHQQKLEESLSIARPPVINPCL